MLADFLSRLRRGTGDRIQLELRYFQPVLSVKKGSASKITKQNIDGEEQFHFRVAVDNIQKRCYVIPEMVTMDKNNPLDKRQKRKS